MSRATKAIILVWCSFSLGAPLFAQNLLITPNEPFNLPSKEDNLSPKYLQLPAINILETIELELERLKNTKVNRQVFNKLYNKPKVNEKEKIRTEWKRAFGIDVWLPYYKAKELENWISDRFSIEVFKMKGRPQCENNECKYTFTTKF
jgi:hypothetical protein